MYQTFTVYGSLCAGNAAESAQEGGDVGGWGTVGVGGEALQVNDAFFPSLFKFAKLCLQCQGEGGSPPCAILQGMWLIQQQELRDAEFHGSRPSSFHIY